MSISPEQKSKISLYQQKNQIMQTNLLRKLALMQHLGEDFFTIERGEEIVAFEGLEEGAIEQWKSETEALEDAPTFEEWTFENLIEVEEAGDEGTDDYLVLTDSEADEKWDEYLDSYIDEFILSEIPKNFRNYFDDEKWKSDARMDGRGHSLSSYDGHESEETVEGETFYIYRIN